VEGTGICDSAWILARIPALIVGYKSDEEYLAVAAAKNDATHMGKLDDLEAGNQFEANKRYNKQSSVVTESIDSDSSDGEQDPKQAQ
jgi:hypothetical protein